jgi:hypothetical protein
VKTCLARDGNGYVYFKRQGDASYTEAQKVPFSVRNCAPSSGCYGNASFYEYTKDMYSAHNRWRGIIKGIRIDPADDGVAGTNRDTIAFDYIRLTRAISTSTIKSLQFQELVTRCRRWSQRNWSLPQSYG